LEADSIAIGRPVLVIWALLSDQQNLFVGLGWDYFPTARTTIARIVGPHAFVEVRGRPGGVCRAGQYRLRDGVRVGADSRRVHQRPSS
jgi:hypothetical protein